MLLEIAFLLKFLLYCASLNHRKKKAVSSRVIPRRT